MTRGKLLALALGTCCLLPGACARVTRAVGVPSSSSAPDPATALVVSVLSDSIYLVDPGTGAQKTLVTGLADFQSGFATWAPDHHRVAYGNAGISILDASTDKVSVLKEGQLLSMPTWSPDGKQIAYGDGVHLWITPSSRATPILLPLPNTLAAVAMDWSKNGAIAFEGVQLDCNVAGPCQSTDQSDLWTIRPDGDSLIQVTHIGSVTNPKWSPDGSHLLFVRQVKLKKSTQSQLWVVKANGGGPRRVTSQTNVVAAAWSRTGAAVAMVCSGSQPDTVQVWLANADGTSAHPVGTPLPGSDATIDW